MNPDELNEVQTFLQMYDKGILSRKTLLAKVGLDEKEEQEQIEKEKEADGTITLRNINEENVVNFRNRANNDS